MLISAAESESIPVSVDAKIIAEVLRLTPGGCLVLESGIIQGANDEAVQVAGVPRDRLVGAALADLASDQHHEVVRAASTSERSMGVQRISIRLARGLAPVELSFRALNASLTVVGLRSMELEHQLSALAGGELTHDQVTGLPDRYHLLEQLHHRLTIATHQPLAVIGLWVDDLPGLAVTKGTKAVERVIRQVAERVQTKLRGPDLLGRFDEAAFLALLTTDSDIAQLRLIAERLRDEVVFPVSFERGLVSFTASVMVGEIGMARPSIEKVQSKLDAVGRLTINGQGNRTELVSF